MIEDNTLLLYGVSMNKSRDYDDEYLANMTGKKPQNRQPTSSLEPLPLKEIREALTYQDPAEEPESQAYIRARGQGSLFTLQRFCALEQGAACHHLDILLFEIRRSTKFTGFGAAHAEASIQLCHFAF